MNIISQFTMNGTSIPIYNTIEKPYILCYDILVKQLEHNMIQDSHLFRTNKKDNTQYLYQNDKWYYTENGIQQALQRSHKKESKELLLQFNNHLAQLRLKSNTKNETNQYQQIITQITNTELLVQELNKYKDILSVQHMLFEGKQIKIYGTIEEPLFLANDIICGLLEYKQLEDNRFYKDNKNDILCVKRATGKMPDGQQLHKNKDNQYSLQNIYLTEIGLYKCLFRSNKPIAELFQTEVSLLLKNIRLGNISLIIKNTELVQQQLQQYKEQIQDLSANHEQVYKKMNRYLDIANKAKHKIGLYELEDEQGRKYRGQSKSLKTRLYQHRRNSCSPAIRNAYKRGEKVKERLIREVDVYTDDDIKYEEAKFIQEVEPELLLNRNIPNPDMNRITNRTDISSPLLIDQNDQELSHISEITSIQEQQSVHIQRISAQKIKSDALFKERYNSLIQFVTEQQRLPSHKSDIQQEQQLGIWVTEMKRKYNRTLNPLGKDKILQLEKIPGWKWKTTIDQIESDSFDILYEQLKNYVQKFNIIPSPDSKNADIRKLAQWIFELRAQYTNKQLTEQQQQLIQQLYQDWSWYTNDSWYMIFIQFREYVQQSGYPKRCSNQEQQNTLYNWMQQQKSLYSRNLLNNERTALLNQLEQWNWQQSDLQDQWTFNYNQVKEYMSINNGKVPTKDKLGKWCGHQRESYKGKELSEQRIQLLESLGNGWYWNNQQKLLK